MINFGFFFILFSDKTIFQYVPYVVSSGELRYIYIVENPPFVDKLYNVCQETMGFRLFVFKVYP